MADDRIPISAMPLSENLDDDDLFLVVEDDVTKKAEVGYLKTVFGGGSGGSSAKTTTYDNTESGLVAEDVQDAIDELADDISVDYTENLKIAVGEDVAGTATLTAGWETIEKG